MSTLIDIKILPATQSDGYESWWRVGVAEVSENLMYSQQHSVTLSIWRNTKRDEVDAVLKKGDVRLGIAPSPGQTMICPSLAGRFRLNSVSMRWHLRL